MLFSPSRLCSCRMRCRPFISNRLALVIDALQGEWRVNFLNVNTVNCSCTAASLEWFSGVRASRSDVQPWPISLGRPNAGPIFARK